MVNGNILTYNLLQLGAHAMTRTSAYSKEKVVVHLKGEKVIFIQKENSWKLQNEEASSFLGSQVVGIKHLGFGDKLHHGGKVLIGFIETQTI